MTEHILEARSLVKKQDGKVFLDGINLHLEKGESIAFLGDDTQANQMLLEVLCSMEPTTSGDLFIDGLNTKYDLKRVKKKVAYISNFFDNELSVIANLDIYSRLYDIPKKTIEKRISEYLRIYDLEEHMGSSPADLSEFKQFKLAYIRAKIIEPEIVFMNDEFGQFNDLELLEVTEFIEDLKSKSTMIFTTKSPVYAYKYAKKVAVFTNGKIYEYADTKESALKNMANEVIEFSYREDEIDYFISRISKGTEYYMLNDRFYLFTKHKEESKKLLEIIHSDEIIIRKPDIRDLLIRHKVQTEGRI